ncbi:SCP2 domain-containing protein [Oceanobacter sp. 4_MG-2023]|uniref:ubiquinone biosynthesis accessory factor UbiJ n=1 Tax=Oceanobacter sp. 4_MG-2023 TaxID=3062623 RepID=UPI002735C73E|nr:SCP2 sterol-binding domain-containing protein [Oceanobacter sp. 4_MG-2023]MDP2547750.1 SCP2 sterol-binding domain-containing protein [Oceanobacter sp. 4_MG-2023]
MFSLPAELTHALCLPWEAAINHALRYDPATLQQLGRYNGRLVHIRLVATGTLSLRILDQGIELGLSQQDPDELAMADVTLTGTLPDFISLARANNKASVLMSGAVAIEGDTELAMALSRLMDQLDIDWEAMISPATGGLIAHQIGAGLRGLMSWGQATAKTMSAAARDYAVEEAGLLVSQTEMDQVADQIDQLKLATDRLAARIQLLEASRSTQPGKGEK